MAFKMKNPFKHGKLKDFKSGKKGHNPDTMSAEHEDWHLKQSKTSPLEHMGYKVKIQKGKVISEEKKPHNKFKTETEHEEYHDLFPAKPFTDAEGRPFTKKRKKRKRKPDVRRTIGPGKNFNKAKSTGTGGKAGGGMTEKGVREYRRKNPGSKLKTAVTTPPSKLKKGSKAAKRRKSFCARSKGWKSKRGLAARRRWNC